jgi:cation:H+ antiporter|tara:strand:+ start:464 stop:1432 length:969 start_codon:yes stop_codon:yes gene_type:complete
MITSLFLLSIGIFILIKGSDFFVDGATSIARIARIPLVIIGLTVVAFATSAPEILVSFVAAMNDESDLAIGNAIGSNTANIALVLGSMAIVRSVPMKSSTIKKLVRNLLIISFLMIIPFFDNVISRIEGQVILFGFFLTMFWLVKYSIDMSKKSDIDDKYLTDQSLVSQSILSVSDSIFCLLIGLFLLFYGADVVVIYAVDIAQSLKISETIIGITIIAIGTSLPELSVSITSALKGQHGLAVGNIIGSNIFNLLAVIGLGTAISPAYLQEDIFNIHLMLMFSLTLFIFFITFRKNDVISRPEGFLLLLTFLSYMGYIILTN